MNTIGVQGHNLIILADENTYKIVDILWMVKNCEGVTQIDLPASLLIHLNFK